MAFTSSGSTNCINLTAYYTPKGREFVFNGVYDPITDTNKSLNIKYFSFSDNDINYFVAVKLKKGNVPDISGDFEDCIFSLNENYNHKPSIFTN